MSDNKNPKVLTLDNIDILKTYIDRNIKSVNEQISDTDKKWEDKYNVISEEQQEKLNEKIEEAKNNLTERYEEKLANLESKINNATDEELSILINKIEILKSDFEQCNTALDKIKEDISDNSSIFNAAELDELINCANIEETYVDEDGNLNSEKILAKNITALVARFGTVKAESLTGDFIEGKTVVSLEKSPYSEKPMWGLYPDGSGHLAGGNIEWNNTGDVVLGPDVKISWDNVTGKDDFLNNVIENYDDTIKDYISNYINDEASEALSSALAEVEILRDEAELAVKNLNTTFGTQLETTRQELLADAESKVATALETSLSNLNTIKTELEQKIANGESSISNITNEIDNLSDEINALDAVNNSIQSRLDRHDSVLNESNLKDIASAALIEGTNITGDSISTENVMATNIVGLVAKFGTVKAANIQGDTISGKTIQSTTNRNDTDINNGEPAWKINNNGQITIINVSGIKSEIGGDDIIKIFNTDNEEYLTLNNLGLNFGENTLYRGDRIYMTDGLEDGNTVVISPKNGSTTIHIGDCDISVSGINNRINLSVGDYTIALSKNGIEFYGLEPGYLYVDENCQLTTKN